MRIWQCFYLLLELLLYYHIYPLRVYFFGVGFAVAGGIFTLDAMVLEYECLGELVLFIGITLMEEEYPNHFQYLAHR